MENSRCICYLSKTQTSFAISFLATYAVILLVLLLSSCVPRGSSAVAGSSISLSNVLIDSNVGLKGIEDKGQNDITNNITIMEGGKKKATSSSAQKKNPVISEPLPVS